MSDLLFTLQNIQKISENSLVMQEKTYYNFKKL